MEPSDPIRESVPAEVRARVFIRGQFAHGHQFLSQRFGCLAGPLLASQRE